MFTIENIVLKPKPKNEFKNGMREDGLMLLFTFLQLLLARYMAPKVSIVPALEPNSSESSDGVKLEG